MAKTSRWRTMMVALGATDASALPLMRKALQLADRFGAAIRVLHVAAPTDAFAPDDLELKSKELHRLVEKRPRGIAVDVTTSVVRDYPIADAIVRQVLKYEPDLLVAESHRRGKLSRALMTQTDWELIRNCPCPLWLSKSDRLPRELKALAAVDPYHSRAKPTRLDDIILRTALSVTGDKPEHVMACHAYAPAVAVMPVMSGELYWPPLTEKELRDYEDTVRKTMARGLSRYHIPLRNQLLLPGDPASALVQAARKHHASVMVMGAISRSALTRFFIGNTAERVIDDVECDLLVVKPTDFRTPVLRRTPRLVGQPAAARAGSSVVTHLHQ